MRWWHYSLIALGTLLLSMLSALAVFMNPVTLLFMNLAGPVVRLLGRSASIGGFSSLDSAIPISALWPVTLAPIYWLSYRKMKWKSFGCAALFVLAGFLIALVVLLIHSSAVD